MGDPFVARAAHEVRVRELLEQLEDAAKSVGYIELEAEDDKVTQDAISEIEGALEAAAQFVAETLDEIRRVAA